MKFLFTPAFAALLAASCAPVPKAVVVTPTEPPKAAPVAPVVEAVRSDAARTAAVSAKLETQVAGVARSTGALREEMEKALAEADRLKQAKTATEIELVGLWQMLSASNQRVRDLFAEAEAALAIAEEQRALREQAEQNLVTLARLASARDAEADALRAQRVDLINSLQAEAATAAALEAKLVAAEKRAAVGTYLKGCIWFVVIAIIVLILLKLFRPL